MEGGSISRPKENPQFPEHINHTEENPLKEFFVMLLAVTSLVVICVLVLVLAARFLAPTIPFSWELKLTSAFQETITEQSIDDEELAITEELTDLGNQILPHMAIPKDMSFSFHYIDDKAPNAFATLGGHIFVTRGLLTELDSENGLAMVLAHEIAHVTNRHPIQALSRGALIQLVFSVVFGGQGSGAVQSILGQAGLVTLLSFNRDMERESDTDAVAAMLSLYGHLEGANEFFVKMKMQSVSAEWTAMFETHPGLEERIQMIESSKSSSSLHQVKPLSSVFLSLRE